MRLKQLQKKAEHYLFPSGKLDKKIPPRNKGITKTILEIHQDKEKQKPVQKSVMTSRKNILIDQKKQLLKQIEKIDRFLSN